MLAQKHYQIVFSFFMAFLMSGIMSLVLSFVNLGFVTDLLSVWLKAWGLSFVVAFPVIMIASPAVTYLVSKIVLTEKN